jgi:hypothetical protein
LDVDEFSTLPYLLELLSVKDSGIEQIPISPEARKDRMIEAMKRIPLKGSVIRPLIMAIEDLHWIDRSSEEVLKYLLERSVAHNPELASAYTFLMASYAYLGRDKEARKALDRYIENAPFTGSPKLFHIMRNRPFKNQEVADRFAQGLIKAGWPEPHNYYKIKAENVLAGEEIRCLLFGKKLSGIEFYYGKQWWQDISKDGKFTRRHGSRSSSGMYSVEGDLLCKKYQKLFKGTKFYMTLFRNPEGTAEKKDEYLMVTGANLFAFSVQD